MWLRMIYIEKAALNKRFSQVHGKKVVLRLFSVLDITDEYVGWLNDSEVVKYSNQRFVTHTVSSCKQYAATFDRSDNLFVKIERQTDRRFIGTLTAYVSVPHGTADVGIMIGCRSVWGQGFGYDAWSSMLTWLLAQKEIRKVTAGTMSVNVGMIRLMEHSGMHLEAVRSKQEVLDGVACDMLYYAKFRDDKDASNFLV